MLSVLSDNQGVMEYFRGRSSPFHFSSFLNGGQLFKERILSPKSKVLSIRVDFILEEPSGVDLVLVLLFYVHGKHLRSCRDGQLT